MLSVTIPNITPSQNTPVLPNMRRIVTRPRGASSSRRNSAKPSLATILRPPSWGITATVHCRRNPNRFGRFVPNRYAYYRPRPYWHPHAYAPGYYYGGQEPWNRPSPTGHVANQLNRQQLMCGY